MTNEIQRVEAKAPITLDARGVKLDSIEALWRFATAVSQSPFAPRDLKDPASIAIAIQYGLELGLTPMAALQNIAVINGRPCVWGDALCALVRASGLLEYMKETDDGETATCEVKRVGEPEPVVRTFSMADAQQAGLRGKSGPWSSYPKRMRQMRARGFALRDTFADLLKGMQVREEVDDYRGKETKGAPEALKEALGVTVETPPTPEQVRELGLEPIEDIRPGAAQHVPATKPLVEAGGDHDGELHTPPPESGASGLSPRQSAAPAPAGTKKKCGRTDCNGDHQDAAANEFARKVTHHDKGFGHESCPCHVCQDMRNRKAARDGKGR